MKYCNRPAIALLMIATGAFALSSGPGMPEYNDFESVDNTDLVNLATGGFTYTIPVMTVPGPGLGFPIVLSYHAGIQPEQEASWVGLGWNLQAGAITRQVNNVPDDFQGTMIQEKIESQHIHGWMASVGWNAYTVGLSWDSEHGLGGMLGLSVGLGGKKSPFSIGLTGGVNGVYEGVGITFNTSGSLRGNGPTGLAAKLSIGAHSKRGMTAGLGAGVNIRETNESNAYAAQTSASLASAGVSLSSKSGVKAGASLGVGISAFSSVKGMSKQTSTNVWVPIWTPWTGYMEFNWGMWDFYIDGLQEDKYYGFLYSDSQGMGCANPNDGKCHETAESYDPCPWCAGKKRVRKMDYVNAGEYSNAKNGGSGEGVKVGYTGEDIYSVQTQGISGTFKPYRTEDGDYYSYISNQDYDYQEECQGFTGSWFGINCDRTATINYGEYFEGKTGCTGIPGETCIPFRNMHSTSASTAHNLVWRFNEDPGGALYTIPDPMYRDANPEIVAASRRIEPIYEGSAIIGWTLTSSDGVKYLYTRALHNFAMQTLSSSNEDMTGWTRRETPGYAYAWLLTAILSPDYVRIGAGTDCIGGGTACLPDGDDLGGWVRFGYTEPRTVAWESQKTPSSFSPDLTPSSWSVSKGLKNVSYLSSIETPTHEAVFDIAEESRKDGIPPQLDNIGFQATFEKTAQVPIDEETCQYSIPPRSSPTFPYKIRIPDQDHGGVPEGTKVTLMARRHEIWSKWTCECGFLCLPVTCGRFCRDGQREAVLGTFTLNSSTYPKDAQGNYQVEIARSTEIISVRVILGEASNSAARLAYLRGIKLLNKQENKEVSAVGFSYDYSLAQGTPNSESKHAEGDGGDQGRLTLRGIRTGATTQGPWNTPYVFSYNGSSVKYGSNNKDSWGYYCASCMTSSFNSRHTPDGTANAWNLSSITTPSGSQTLVEYEPTTIDYAEGLPTVIDGDEIGQYFEIDNSNVVATTDNFDTDTPFPFDRRKVYAQKSIPSEIAGYFAGKYVMYLGRLDVNNNSGVTNLRSFPDIGANEYVIEAPRMFLEEDHPEPGHPADPQLNQTSREVLLYGLFSNLNPTPGTSDYIATSRLKCDEVSPPLKTCEYFVGRKLATLSSASIHLKHRRVHRIYDVDGNLVATSEANDYNWPTAVSARVWGVFEKSGGKPESPYGGGIRVSKLTYREPFSGKDNIVSYQYGEASTPTLPPSMSNYGQNIRYREAEGINPYLGSPAILHGKVAAHIQFTESQEYVTEYGFITSQDLPTRVEIEKLSQPGSGNLRYAVKVLDRSGLWGSLWSKVDFNTDSPRKVVREEFSEWGLRITPARKAGLGIGIEVPLGLEKGNKTVVQENDEDVQVHSPASTERNYFTITQKLWGNRFISRNCEDLREGADKETCVKNAGGAQSAQMEVVRFAPLSRRSNLNQDGVSKTTETNLFDFLSGAPLLDITSNTMKDGSEEYFATVKSPAYHHYADMRNLNMLSQEFSSTVFRFEDYPDEVDFMNPATGDLQKVIRSEFTLWKNYGTSTNPQFRKEEGFALRDKEEFSLPYPSLKNEQGFTGRWLTMGKNVSYDPFGHATEFQDALGRSNSQIFGQNNSLPVAFAQNAKRDEIFHLSFETGESHGAPLFGVTSSSPHRARTGSKSLKITNCLESGVSKPECGGGSHTFTCFDLPSLPTGQSYVASAWYFDQFRGSNPDNPMDETYLDKTTAVTRPGIYLGIDNGNPACAVASFPNGGRHDLTSPILAPAANGDWNAKQRAMGDRDWKRIWVELKPPAACGTDGRIANALLCLYAGKFMPGSDVFFDEVRVRPEKSLMNTYAYDAAGNMISSADANEVTQRFEYDAFGNLTGVRNDDGKLLSEQAKRYVNRPSSVRFPEREPSVAEVCGEPIFTEASGARIVEEYTLLESSDTRFATIHSDGKRACTWDRGGTVTITMQTPAGSMSVPLTVKGTQLGLMDISPVGGGAESDNYFGINLGPIEQVENRIRQHDPDATINTIVFRLSTTKAARLLGFPSDLPCFDGPGGMRFVEGIDDVGDCNLFRMHFSLSRLFTYFGEYSLPSPFSPLPFDPVPGVEADGMMKDGTRELLFSPLKQSDLSDPFNPGGLIPNIDRIEALLPISNGNLGLTKSVAISRVNYDQHINVFNLNWRVRIVRAYPGSSSPYSLFPICINSSGPACGTSGATSKLTVELY